MSPKEIVAFVKSANLAAYFYTASGEVVCATCHHSALIKPLFPLMLNDEELGQCCLLDGTFTTCSRCQKEIVSVPQGESNHVH